MTLEQAWQNRNELQAKGDNIKAEGYKLWAEGDKLWNEVFTLPDCEKRHNLYAKGSKIFAEGDKLIAEANKLQTEGDKLYKDAVTAKCGQNAVIDWKTGEVKLSFLILDNFR